MIGIVSYGAYVPFHRLKLQAVAEAFGQPGASGEKAVAHFDEDSVSLGVSAALDCLGAGDAARAVDALFLATTTPPYDAKAASATVAAALDLRSDVRAADLNGSLRSASAAILSALDSVRGGAGTALVVTADCRLAAPQGAMEGLFGDGAAAFLFGQGDEVLARVLGAHSHTGESIGHWRDHGDLFVRSWEDRFVQRVYAQTISTACRGAMDACGLQATDFAKVVLAGPAPRAIVGVAEGLGFNKEQIVPPLFQTVGMAGAAHAPMMLAAALETAKPGDRLLFATFGEGSDAIVFEVTPAIEKAAKPRAVSGHLEPKRADLLYSDYLRWKGILPTEPARRPETPRPSVTALFRNREGNLRLYGTRCLACNTPQFPKQRVCAACQAKDQMEPYRFYGRTAKVATFTIDHLAASPATPTVFAVVDFAGGGRMLCEVTDCDPQELCIGMEVEMTFRRLYQAGGVHNYFWKAKPKRERRDGQ